MKFINKRTGVILTPNSKFVIEQLKKSDDFKELKEIKEIKEIKKIEKKK